MRRQVHEALTHSVDALLATKQELPTISPELAADGIDEIVHVVLEGEATPSEQDQVGTLVLHSTDTDDRWTLSIGRGTCEVAGPALALNLWLWGRADEVPLSISGNENQARRLRDKMAADSQ